MVKLKVSMAGTLEFLVETENYRMLSTQEYSWKETPLRSERICDRRDRTGVSKNYYITKFHFSYDSIFFVKIELPSSDAEGQQQQQQQPIEEGQMAATQEIAKSEPDEPQQQQERNTPAAAAAAAAAAAGSSDANQPEKGPAGSNNNGDEQLQNSDTIASAPRHTSPGRPDVEEVILEEDGPQSLATLDAEIAKIRRNLLAHDAELDKLKEVKNIDIKLSYYVGGS